MVAKIFSKTLIRHKKWQQKSSHFIFTSILSYSKPPRAKTQSDFPCRSSAPTTAPGSRTRRISSTSFRRVWRQSAHSPTLLAARIFWGSVMVLGIQKDKGKGIQDTVQVTKVALKKAVHVWLSHKQEGCLSNSPSGTTWTESSWRIQTDFEFTFTGTQHLHSFLRIGYARERRESSRKFQSMLKSKMRLQIFAAWVRRSLSQNISSFRSSRSVCT